MCLSKLFFIIFLQLQSQKFIPSLKMLKFERIAHFLIVLQQIEEI
jgi:hypothetical protein